MAIWTDKDSADLLKRMKAAFDIDGRQFLYSLFKKDNEVIARDDEKDMIYFYKDNFKNIYKVMPVNEFKNEINTYINNGWIAV